MNVGQRLNIVHRSSKCTFTLTNSPDVTAVFNACRNCAFNHFLSAGNLACIHFLIDIKEEPFRSFISAIAAVIPALYDMIVVYFFDLLYLKK